jgi:hypothetical protein
MRDKIKEGVDILMKAALSIGERHSVGAEPRRITDGRGQDPEQREEEHGEVHRSNKEKSEEGNAP